MVLLGVGGTGVEVYNDVSIRMAPLTVPDVDSMVMGLKARRLLEGYRGSKPVNLRALAEVLVDFSRLMMDLEGQVDSVDLNPVFCSPHGCVIGDARVMLAG